MSESGGYQDLTFRDRLATVDGEGKRVRVYPKKPKGKLYNWRWVIAWLLLIFFYVAPFIKLKGDPLILLNVLERRFVFFGNVFFPQDFHLLVLAFIASLVFIILLTVVYGRVFCGWVCPQTVFMEFLYRPIEYIIDGDRKKQIELARQELNGVKIIKRVVKHFLFLVISFTTILIFLSYIIGFNQVRQLVSGWPFENFTGLIVYIVFSLVHYFVFSWFREQVCTWVCPYGRLQGVMLDTNSIVVAYDYKRGEPRGKGENGLKGDCINCFKCVDVCPTGIDIRNGTQLECINCAACIDSCNEVMTKILKPKGLIRYASEKSISEGIKLKLNIRAIAYSAVLVVLLSIIGYLLMIRGKVEITIIRAPGTMFQEYNEKSYSNLYFLQMLNKTRKEVKAELKLMSPAGEIKIIGDELTAKEGEIAKRNFLIILEKKILQSSNTGINIGVYSEGELLETIHVSFVGPNALDIKH
jgi:cytochrome c oxidase accessory protein FixG